MSLYFQGVFLTRIFFLFDSFFCVLVPVPCHAHWMVLCRVGTVVGWSGGFSGLCLLYSLSLCV